MYEVVKGGGGLNHTNVFELFELGRSNIGPEFNNHNQIKRVAV